MTASNSAFSADHAPAAMNKRQGERNPTRGTIRVWCEDMQAHLSRALMRADRADAQSVFPRGRPSGSSVEPQMFFLRRGDVRRDPTGEQVIAGLAAEPVLVREVPTHQGDPFGKRVPAARTLGMRCFRHESGQGNADAVRKSQGLGTIRHADHSGVYRLPLTAPQTAP